LSSNPGVTTEFVERFPGKPWDFGECGLSSNPCVTTEFVERHLDKPWKWGRHGLSRNTFDLEFKRDTAARVIQNGCEHWLWAPVHNGKPGLMASRMIRELA